MLLVPYSTLDQYIQPTIPFKNMITCIRNDDYQNLSKESFSLYFSEHMYQVLHILAMKGKGEPLRKWLRPFNDITIKADGFGKSPFFYSIACKNQYCTQLNLSYIIYTKNQQVLEQSLHAIRNDFFLIIDNSSKQLPNFLSKIFLSTEVELISEPVDFPLFIFSDNYKPNIRNFHIPEIDKKIPVSFRFTAFPFKGTPFSIENISNLELIRTCTNSKIYETSFIRFYIDLNWEAVQNWAIFYSFLLFSNIIVFILSFKYGRTNLYNLSLFLTINACLFAWEATQIISTSFKKHIQDVWNWIDMTLYIFILIWILTSVLDCETEYEEYGLCSIILIRALTGFRVVDGTRYYVRLILASLDSIKYFLIMLCYSTIFFSLLFMISQGKSLDFESIWNQGWSHNFGGEIEMEDIKNYELTYFTALAATVINVVLMLNMLISILGDSYADFSLERNIIDYTEKLQICLEIQKVLFWKRFSTKEKFLHFLPSPFEEDEDQQDWQGKIMHMQKKQERKLDNIHEKISDVETKITTIEDPISKNIEEVSQKVTGIEKSLRKEFDTKLGAMNSKIQAIDSKLSSIESTLALIINRLPP